MHSLTVEKIKKRIQETMERSARNRKTLSQNPEGYVNQMNELSSLNSQQLTTLLYESEQNNRGWNVNPEFPITSHRRTIGKFIVLGKKVVRKFLRWYINPAFEKQRNFNGSVTRSINALVNIANFTSTGVNRAFEEMNNTNQAVQALEEKVNAIAAQQNKQSVELEEKLIEMINRLEERIISTNNALNSLNQKYEQHNKDLQLKIEQLNEMILLLNAKIKKHQRSLNFQHDEHTVEKVNNSSSDKQVGSDSFNYFLFEQFFRGTRSAIKERQKLYLPYFRNKEFVLDIGCGRGEFLELLTENGVKAKGIDTDQDMVEFCREKGFEVEQVNVTDYLSTVNDNTFDGIFMAQVIEHIPPEEISRVIHLIYRALKPGGLFIVETINVQSVYAMNHWFYLDPSHTKPVHPETLRFYLKECGFSKVDMEYLSPVEHKTIAPLHIDGVDTSRFNQSMKELQDFIYGYQDYALLAYK
jgi:O-antigen chain-terminating methyltransferase